MIRRLALGLVVALVAWLLAASSGATVTWHGDEAALLRLSWVARPERIEECRSRTDAELAEQPAHMRQARECRGGSASYRLAVTIDGEPIAEDVLEGGGLRKDRAIFVLQEHPLQPGARRVQIRFSRVEPSDRPVDSADVRRGAVPRSLVLDTVVQVPAAGVVLVSFRDSAFILKLP